MILVSLKIPAIILCLTLAANGDEGKISEPFKHCIDEKCSVPISTAYAVMGYSGDQKNKLSFKQKDTVTVYGKPPVQSVDDLWYVELNGKRGFIARNFLKETKVFNNKKSHNTVESNKDSVLHVSGFQTAGIAPIDASKSDKPATQEVTNENEDSTTVKVISDFNKTITPQETTIETISQSRNINNAEDQNNNVNIATNNNHEGKSYNEDPYESDSEDGSIDTEEDDQLLLEENVNISSGEKQPSTTTENESSSERGQSDNSQSINLDVETIETDNLSETKDKNTTNVPISNSPNSNPLTEQQIDDNLSGIISHDIDDINSTFKHANLTTSSEDSPSVENSLNNNEDSSLNTKQQKSKESIVENASNKPDEEIQPNKIETVIAGTTINYSDISLSGTLEESTPGTAASNNNQPSSENIITKTSSNIPASIHEDESFTQNKEQNLNKLEKVFQNEQKNQQQDTSDNGNSETEFIQGLSHQTTLQNNFYSDPEVNNNESKPPAPITQNQEPLNPNIYNPFQFPKSPSNNEIHENVIHNDLNSITKGAQDKQDMFSPSSDNNTYPKVVNNELHLNTNSIQDKPEIEELSFTTSNIQDKPDVLSTSAHNHIHAKEESGDFNFNTNTLQDNPTSSSHKQEPSMSHNEHVDSTESIEQVSFFDTFLTILPLRDLTSFLHSTSFFTDDSYRLMAIDFVGNSPLLGMSARMVLFLFIVSVTILTFTLGYYFLDIKRQDGKLVGMVNSLQKDLLCYTKECDMLKDELIVTKEKLAGIEDSSFGTDEMVISLKQDIQKRDIKIEDLENELEKTVKELQSTTRAAEQLQSFIDEVMQWKDQTKLEEEMANIEQLQEENDKLTSELESLKSTEETSASELSLMKTMYDDTVNLIKVQQHEIISLKEALTGLKGNDISNENLSNIIDHSEIRARLKNALQEKEILTLQMNDDHNTIKILETELRTTIESLQKSEQGSTRLEVLCDHFKKREADLVKELNTKEALWLSTQGETMTTIEKMQALQSEVQQYKDMCGELRGELANAEASRRSEATEAEKKAHAAWLEARRAQREAEGHKAEAAALRRRLGAPLAPAPAAVSSPLAPPLPMMPMPLPPPLLPPPGLPRPPPLGRHPSPPFNSPFSPSTVLANSPPPRYSDYISDRDYPDRRGRSPYSPTRRSYQRRRSISNERYYDDRRHNQMTETETDYSPPPSPRHRRSMHSPRNGPSSGSGQSSDSDK